MNPAYALKNTSDIFTPALLFYKDLIRRNIARAKKAAESLKEKGSKIVVEKGQIVKISKDKNGIVSKEKLTKNLDGLDRLLVRRFRF
jgi:hypothetical protein